MLGSALRLAVVAAWMLGAAFVAATQGRTAAIGALLAASGMPMALSLWLPRAAHRAFRQGRYRRARWLYRLLRPCLVSRASRAAVDVSLGACALAEEDFDTALAALDAVDDSALGNGARAAWLNNRAYALARAGRDLDTALAACEQAIMLRPDVAGFRHTRGVALLALGRVDDAIQELEGLWDALAGEPLETLEQLEAERCYDLGMAWHTKGERDYAVDYFQRACQAARGSRWAGRAAGYLEPGTIPDRALAELIDG